MSDIKLKEIPGTLGFKASTDGKIYAPQGVEKKQYVNGDGYKTCNVKTHDKGWVTYGVQRLVMLAHRYPKHTDPSTLTVNHKDRDITNNDISNLEWLSVKWNNIHAAVTEENPHRPRIYTVRGNEKQLWDNLQQCSIGLDIDEVTLWDAMRRDKETHGYRIYHIQAKSLIGDRLLKRKQKQGGRPSNTRSPVIALNLKDSMFYIFESARSFYISNKLSRKAIAVRLRNRKLEEVDGWYFVYANDKEMRIALKDLRNTLLNT